MTPSQEKTLIARVNAAESKIKDLADIKSDLAAIAKDVKALAKAVKKG